VAMRAMGVHGKARPLDGTDEEIECCVSNTLVGVEVLLLEGLYCWCLFVGLSSFACCLLLFLVSF